ncbi:hypothetical protein ACU6RQ_19515 (plasmid) [Zobellella denitrificans]
MKKIISFFVVALALISLPPIMSVPLLIYILIKMPGGKGLDWHNMRNVWFK